LTSEVFEREIGGRTLSLEVGKVAGLANGAVTMRYGDTVILVTAVMSAEPREGIDFFPLTVDYEERLYAAGKIPGGWFRREGRPSTAGILTARLTDRPLRPLFPKRMQRRSDHGHDAIGGPGERPRRTLRHWGVRSAHDI